MLTITPRIKADANTLIASTSSMALVLMLGLAHRRVRLERDSRTITIEDRIGWFWKRTRVLAFNQVAAVTYGFEEVSFLPTSRDPIDRFIVGLRPVVGEEVRLFYFVGDGTFTNNGPLPDWWYWDEYVFDYTGSQERESRAFVQLLSKLLNVSIQPSSLTDEPVLGM
jgi:hypothetical protein